MTKPIFKTQSFYTYILLMGSWVFASFIFSKQSPEIILHDEALSITPKEFYIASVTDERSARSAIAHLIPADNLKNGAKPYPIDLRGGGFAAIKQFIEHCLPRNASLRPVIVSLKKCLIIETPKDGGLVKGNVMVALSFGIQQGEEVKPLFDYNGTAKYTRNPGPPQDVEPTLRHVLGNGLVYFNTWMDKQAGDNIKLVKTVTVSFTDYTEKTEGDTIYYSTPRPLTWADFKSKIPQSSYAAEISPSIGYSEHIAVEKGVIKLILDIKVSLPKSACWVKGGNQTDYTLNHEQRHFDIAKIAAEHFKQKIKAENLPVDNYDGPINVDYLDAYRQMDSLQKKYDFETGHGADHFAQQRWNERIDKELKSH